MRPRYVGARRLRLRDLSAIGWAERTTDAVEGSGTGQVGDRAFAPIAKGERAPWHVYAADEAPAARSQDPWHSLARLLAIVAQLRAQAMSTE